MKPRRWFVTHDLTQWRYMRECGDYAGPFFTFPNNPSGIDPWVQNGGIQNMVRAYLGEPLLGPYGIEVR